jgi:putative flippase GtrA
VGCSLNDKLLNLLPAYIVFSMIGDTAGFLFGFFSNKSWTFRHQTAEQSSYFTKYLAVYAVTFVIGQMILYAMVHFGSHIPLVRDPYIAKIASAAICAVLNFLGTNYLVFKHR